MNCLALALIKLIIDFSPYTFQIHQQQHSRKTLRQSEINDDIWSFKFKYGKSSISC